MVDSPKFSHIIIYSQLSPNEYSIRIVHAMTALLECISLNDCFNNMLTGAVHNSHTPADISELLVYSKDWTTEWWSIGVKLGLPVQQLEEIRMNHPFRVQDCCHQMLLLWSRVDPINCYCKLVTALDQLNMKKAANKLAKE